MFRFLGLGLLATAIYAQTYCDDAEECDGETISDTQVDCRGYMSCEEADIDTTIDLVCSGDKACWDADLDAGDDLWVLGYFGAYNVEAQVDDIAYCDGPYSCYMANMTVDNDLHCRGRYACYKTTAYVKDDLMAYSYMGAGRSDLTIQDDAYVYGYYTLYLADVFVDQDLYAYGFRSIYYSQITGPSNVYLYGYYSGYRASIDSEGEDTLTVNSFGFRSGYYMYVRCRSGSECELNCESSGCLEARLICYSGSTCSYTCDDDADCPTVYDYSSTSESEMSSEAIEKLIEADSKKSLKKTKTLDAQIQVEMQMFAQDESKMEASLTAEQLASVKAATQKKEGTSAHRSKLDLVAQLRSSAPVVSAPKSFSTLEVVIVAAVAALATGFAVYKFCNNNVPKPGYEALEQSYGSMVQ